VQNDDRPNLAVTIGPLGSADEPLRVREALALVARLGYRGAQLNGTDPTMRPRDLGASARRDLKATLARVELVCSGIDLFIPPAHFEDPATVTRAVDAVQAALVLGAELGRAPVTVSLPDTVEPSLRDALVAEAQRVGSRLLVPCHDLASIQKLSHSPAIGASIDCAAVLAAGGRPEELLLQAGDRFGAIRVVDLLRSGLRGPILEPRESRLDVLALKAALSLSDGARSMPAAVVDARQWSDARAGITASIARWISLA
jgi:sugar phosphate isomerase/epimerase